MIVNIIIEIEKYEATKVGKKMEDESGIAWNQMGDDGGRSGIGGGGGGGGGEGNPRRRENREAREDEGRATAFYSPIRVVVFDGPTCSVRFIYMI